MAVSCTGGQGRMRPVESESLGGLLDAYAELEEQLADPAVHADQARARKLGRRYSDLPPVVKTVGELETTRSELEAAKELAAEDSSFAEEVDRLGKRVSALETKLAELLLPRDPYDGSDVV